MDWISTEDYNPITYITGDFDGKNSDPVLIADDDYKISIAFFNEGFMDGFQYKDWYDEKEYLLDKKPTHWMRLPKHPNE